MQKVQKMHSNNKRPHRSVAKWGNYKKVLHLHYVQIFDFYSNKVFMTLFFYLTIIGFFSFKIEYCFIISAPSNNSNL
jgi:hypothetical protein